MNETSDKLKLLSENEIIIEFRNLLTSLFPILFKLDIISTNTETFDDFDEVVDFLWKVIICNSFFGSMDLVKVQI